MPSSIKQSWTPRRVGLAIVGLSMIAALAACGGGSDDGGPPPPVAATNTPPASASANSAGFIAFLKTVVVTNPENTDPLDVSAFVAPTDDTGAFDTSI